MTKRKYRSILSPQAAAAQTATQLRYGTERRGLAEALAEARAQRDQALAAERGVAAYMRNAVAQAQPAIRDAYAKAIADTSDDALMAGLPADSPITAGRGARLQQLLAGDQARTLADVAQRGIDAAAGRISGERHALAQYASAAEKIQRQARESDAEAALFFRDEMNKLLEAQAARDVTMRGQDITARGQDVSAETARRERLRKGREAARERALKRELDTGGAAARPRRGLGSATVAEERTLRANLDYALAEFARASRLGTRSGKEIEEALVAGRRFSTRPDPEDDEGVITREEAGRIVEQPLARAAREIVTRSDHRMTLPTMRALQELGLHVSYLPAKYRPMRRQRRPDLGVTSPGPATELIR